DSLKTVRKSVLIYETIILSVAPLFLVQNDNKNKNVYDSRFIFDLDGEKSNTPFNVMLEITNSGIGDAVDFRLRFVSYNEEDMRQSLVIDFFKRDSSIRVLIDLSIYLPEIPDDIDEHLDRNPEGFIIPYRVPKKYEHSGGSVVKLEITYKDIIGNKYCQELAMHIQTGFKKECQIDKHWVHQHPSIMLDTKKARYIND
ncbi:hypothetical protein, partial [Alkalibaculum bacchi]|uniref:hypothetical protein n=1 Tax=Alkalibaculum bacchi TaxID=645887 RepID=UPI0026F218BF